MPLQYFRRYRMEVDLRQTQLPSPELPAGYFWIPWQPEVLERHAYVKCQSFRDEADSEVFPCLGDFYGCLRLMQEIAAQDSFLPETTWLIGCREPQPNLAAEVATIQGLAHSAQLGAIQNVGVIAAHRGRGLGRALVLQSLHGFREAGLNKVYLEVTATNLSAVTLYANVGFRVVRTMYRPAASVEAVG